MLWIAWVVLVLLITLLAVVVELWSVLPQYIAEERYQRYLKHREEIERKFHGRR